MLGVANKGFHRAARRIYAEAGARDVRDALLPAPRVLASRRPAHVPHSAPRPLFVEQKTVSIRRVAAGGGASLRRTSLRNVGNLRGLLWWGQAEPPTARVGSGADPYEWMRDGESKEVKRYAEHPLPFPHCEDPALSGEKSERTALARQIAGAKANTRVHACN